MSLICSECTGYVMNHGIGILLGTKKARGVDEGNGFVACYEHLNKMPIPLHPLEELGNGPIAIIDERTGYKDTGGFLAFSEPTPRVKILGYLSIEEAKEYFPNTLKLLV